MSPGLSRLWVSLVTGAPKALVGPLVQSLRHEMVVRDHRLAERLGIVPMGVAEAIRVAVEESDDTLPHAFRGARASRGPSLVRSVQRMSLPAGWNAKRAAIDYLLWLPRVLSGLLRVEVASQERFRFVLALLNLPLLELQRAPERSSRDRQL